jgi:hypothetical protein
MPWFRLEDSFHSHPKVIAAGNEAIGLYARCGTYAAEHLTNGFIREDIAVLYGASDTGSRRNPGTGKPETLAETLVRTKLWRRTRGGWRMPDYLEYNPSKEAVDNERKARAERQRRWRERRGRRVSNASGDAPVTPAPPRPAPKEAGRGKPAPNAREPRGSANGRASPPGSAVRAEKPPWCGYCDPVTRQRGDPPERCPACHPLAAAPEGPP